MPSTSPVVNVLSSSVLKPTPESSTPTTWSLTPFTTTVTVAVSVASPSVTV
ncbi:hypothetical protein D3C83_35070 [compost metagenome]